MCLAKLSGNRVFLLSDTKLPCHKMNVLEMTRNFEKVSQENI